jgi:hypothetical protein
MFKLQPVALAAAVLLAGPFAAMADEIDDGSLPSCVSRTEVRTGPVPASVRGKPLTVAGLTADQRLVCFRERSPQNAVTIGVITGLSGDTRIVGIDYRVQDGQLYGVGEAGGVYTLSTSTAMATKVSQLTVALAGTNFGVDFNPAADRLRIVSDSGQSLRHNVNAGGVTLLDGGLTYTAPPAAPVAALGVVASAYTNNDLVATTATTLFNLDGNLDQIVVQSPPNNGVLAATGKLGVDAVGAAGLDIHSTLRNGATVENRALAAIRGGSGSALYEVDVTTGAAALLGGFAGTDDVVAIAIPLNQR